MLKNRVQDTLVMSKISTYCSKLSERNILADLRAWTENALCSGTGELPWTVKVIWHTAAHRNIL